MKPVLDQSQLSLTEPATLSGCHGNPASLLLGSSSVLMLFEESTQKNPHLQCLKKSVCVWVIKALHQHVNLFCMDAKISVCGAGIAACICALVSLRGLVCLYSARAFWLLLTSSGRSLEVSLHSTRLYTDGFRQRWIFEGCLYQHNKKLWSNQVFHQQAFSPALSPPNRRNASQFIRLDKKKQMVSGVFLLHSEFFFNWKH